MNSVIKVKGTLPPPNPLSARIRILKILESHFIFLAYHDFLDEYAPLFQKLSYVPESNCLENIYLLQYIVFKLV